MGAEQHKHTVHTLQSTLLVNPTRLERLMKEDRGALPYVQCRGSLIGSSCT